jgi:protein TonB
VVQTPQVAGAELDDTPVSFVNNRPPRYPEQAYQRGWHGTVLLRLEIDAKGTVTQVSVVQSSGFPVLDAEALNTVRQWRARAARRNGQPTDSVEILPISFVLP